MTLEKVEKQWCKVYVRGSASSSSTTAHRRNAFCGPITIPRVCARSSPDLSVEEIPRHLLKHNRIRRAPAANHRPTRLSLNAALVPVGLRILGYGFSAFVTIIIITIIIVIITNVIYRTICRARFGKHCANIPAVHGPRPSSVSLLLVFYSPTLIINTHLHRYT